MKDLMNKAVIPNKVVNVRVEPDRRTVVSSVGETEG